MPSEKKIAWKAAAFIDPDEKKLAEMVLDVCYFIHKKLGPGLYESVYTTVLVYELRKMGLIVEEQVPISLVWDNRVIGECFQAGILVNRTLIVELKVEESLRPVHQKELLTHVRVAEKRLGLLVNFGAANFNKGVKKVVNNLLPLA